METREISVSNDVIFHEDNYPFAARKQQDITKGDTLQQNLGWTPSAYCDELDERRYPLRVDPRLANEAHDEENGLAHRSIRP